MTPRRGDRGFTLIELLVVVVIIGILAGVALPKLFSAICTANQGAADAQIGGINSAIVLYVGQNRGRLPFSDQAPWALENTGPNAGVYWVRINATQTPWFVPKYYELPTQDPWGLDPNQTFTFSSFSANGPYIICYTYNNGYGCDGVYSADDTAYFDSRIGAIRTNGGYIC